MKINKSITFINLQMAAIDKCADFWYNVNCSSVSYTEERNMYKELILKLSEENGFVKINPPCPEKKIKRAEKAVGYTFPKELENSSQSLTETAGFFGR